MWCLHRQVHNAWVSAKTHTKGFVPCTGQHQHPHKGLCAMYRSIQHPKGSVPCTGQCQHPHKGFCAMYGSAPTPTQRFCAMYRSAPTPTHRVLCHVQVSTNTHTKGFVPCTGQYQHPHKYTGQCQHPHTGFCAMYRSAPTPTQRVLCHVQVSPNTHTKGLCQVLTLTSQSYRLLVSMSPGCCSGIVRETSLMPSCPWRGTGWQDLRSWGTGWSHNTTLSPAE